MHFQELESRTLYAITSALDAAGTLTVQGDGANDVITVQERGSYLVVNQSPADMTWTPPLLTLFPAPSGTTLSTNFSTGYVRPAPNIPGYFTLSAVQRIVVRGGAGDDRIVINSSIPASVSGEDGNDVIYGSFASDNLDGGNGNDEVHGRPGDDVLAGGSGNDTLAGDDGNDFLAADTGDDTYNGGAGRDTVSYAGQTIPARGPYGSYVYIDPSYMSGVITDDPYVDLWLERDQIGQDVEDFVGTPGDDYFVGTNADNTIYCGGGNDRVMAQGGNDTIYGEAGNDWILGDWGNDVIYGGDGDDTLEGGDGNDLLDGGAGADNLIGGDGDDVFYARDFYTDHIDGGNGFDRAYVDKFRVGFSTYLLDDLANVEYW